MLLPNAATASPCRGVRMSGRRAQRLATMPSAYTDGIVPADSSPPTEKDPRPAPRRTGCRAGSRQASQAVPPPAEENEGVALGAVSADDIEASACRCGHRVIHLRGQVGEPSPPVGARRERVGAPGARPVGEEAADDGDLG